MAERTDSSPTTSPIRAPRVGLFVTCLVDLFRPNVGFAALELLQRAGCDVEIPSQQTCCGQPAYNNGDTRDARDIAKQVIDVFADYDYTVAPSGSCAGMIKEHYPRLFDADAEYYEKALALSSRCFELTEFLDGVADRVALSESPSCSYTYHDSCSGLRELGIKQQPRTLLARIAGLSVREMQDSNVCCGFGGTFCVKYPDISGRMVADKADAIRATGADMVLGGDLGCLMNIAGRLKRVDSTVSVYHVAEVLAGKTDVPPIAGSRS